MKATKQNLKKPSNSCYYCKEQENFLKIVKNLCAPGACGPLVSLSDDIPNCQCQGPEKLQGHFPHLHLNQLSSVLIDT